VVEVRSMFRIGEGSEEAIRPDFNQSIFIDFAGAKITSDAGFLLMREVDQRFALMTQVSHPRRGLISWKALEIASM
jgi:hypothetical protein